MTAGRSTDHGDRWQCGAMAEEAVVQHLLHYRQCKPSHHLWVSGGPSPGSQGVLTQAAAGSAWIQSPLDAPVVCRSDFRCY